MNETLLPSCAADYELLTELGTDGPSRVYRVQQKSLDRTVTLYLVRLDDLEGADEVERFITGARAAARLDHPALVRVYDVGQGDGWAYVASSFVEGKSLDTIVQSGPLEPKLAAELVRRVAVALASAHKQGVIHGAIEPRCILVDAAKQPRVSGFGSARSLAQGATLTKADGVLSAYTAPERVVDSSTTKDPRIDVYGLGGLLYTALTGKPLFVKSSLADLAVAIAEEIPTQPSKLRAKLPKDLDAICLRCLAKRPEDRFADAAAVATALQRWLKPDSVPVIADPMTDTVAFSGASTRRMAGVKHPAITKTLRKRSLVAIVLGMAMILGATAWWGLGRLRTKTDTAGNSDALSGQRPALAVAPFDEPSAKRFQQEWARYLGTEVEVTNSIGMKFRLIPPGEFDMGSTDEEIQTRLQSFAATSPDRDAGTVKFMNDQINSEGPRRRIQITQPFWFSTYETTIGDFQRFCDETGYVAYSERRKLQTWGIDESGRYVMGTHFNWRMNGEPVDPRRAVVSLSWYDMEAFCHWNTWREGVVYRVPTEAEWEYACRAGTTGSTFCATERLREYANVPDQSLHRVFTLEGGLTWHPWDDGFPTVAPVGSFLANPFGLHDTIGNLWEICSDWYAPDAFAKGERIDPTGPITGEARVARGGSHDMRFAPESMTATFRGYSSSDNVEVMVGFRVVREIDSPADSPMEDVLQAKWLGRARQAVDEAAALPLIGDFNMVRAIDRWKVAALHVQRATKLSQSDADQKVLNDLASIADFGIKFSQGVRDVDRRLIESLSDKGWKHDYNSAAQSLGEVFHSCGWDVSSMKPAEAAAKLESLPKNLQQSVKHWLTRWELFASAAKRPEATALRAIESSLYDDSWNQQFLAARSIEKPSLLLKLASSKLEAQPISERILLVEALAVRNLLTQAGVRAAIKQATAASDLSLEQFWLHWRAAECAESVKSNEARDEMVASLEAAQRLSPENVKIKSRWMAVKTSSPTGIERGIAEWVLEQGGVVQIWYTTPTEESWAHFPVRKLAMLPQRDFHVSAVSLADCKISDSDLKRLNQLPHLDIVVLDGTNLSVDGLCTWMGEIKPLQSLSLERTAANDLCLASVPEVSELRLRKSQCTAKEVSNFRVRHPNTLVVHESLETQLDTEKEVLRSGFALSFDSESRVDATFNIAEDALLTYEAWVQPKPAVGFNNSAILDCTGTDATPNISHRKWEILTFTEQHVAVIESESKKYVSAWSQRIAKANIYRDLTHIAAVSDHNEYRVYIDGKLVARQAVPDYFRDTNQRLRIGGTEHPLWREYRQFYGLIGEVRISSKVRYTEDFVPSIRHEPDADTLVLYHFDEGDGKIAQDSSGRNNDGKIIGAKWTKWVDADR